MSIRIPRRLDRAIDWAKAHPRATALWIAWAVATAAVIWFTALRVPALYGVSGFILGGLTVNAWNTVRAVDLLEESARLREQVAGLTATVVPPVDTSAEQLTRRLPRIPEGDRHG